MTTERANTHQPVFMLENATLALATFVFGIMAGFFYTYSVNVSLAFEHLSSEHYTIVQSLVNQNVRHFGFFVFFFGGFAFALVALITNARHWKTTPFILLTLSTLAYLFGIIVLTRQVNLPINAYTEGWDPTSVPADWQSTRDAWNAANDWRTGFSALAFLLALCALAVRATGKKGDRP